MRILTLEKMRGKDMRTFKCECCGEYFEAPTRATKICDSCRRSVKAPGVHKKMPKKKVIKARQKGPDMTRCKTCHYSCRYSD